MEPTRIGVPRTVSARASMQSKMTATTINRSRINLQFTTGCWFKKRSKLHFYSMTANHGTDVACNLSPSPHLLQYVWIDIPSADDCHIDGGFWQLVLVEEESRDRDCAARFGHSLRVRGQPLHGFPYFGFADGHDVVNVEPYMFEIDRADTLRSQSVVHGLRSLLGSRLNDLPGPQAGLRIRCELRLNPYDFCSRLAQLNRRCHAADHSTAAYRHQYGLDFW